MGVLPAGGTSSMGFGARVTLVFSAHVARWLWTADRKLTVKREREREQLSGVCGVMAARHSAL